MMGERCGEMQLLIQADMDGELTPAEAAQAAAHLRDCAGCREVQSTLLAVSGRLRRQAPYHRASEALVATVQARIAAVARPEPSRPAGALLRRRFWWQRATPFGAGFALAACLVFALMARGDGGLQDAVVAGHIRALQPGHLMDVVSADQHTVKPWFDGRLDYAPPVKDLEANGFPLAGGRLDYLAGRPVAVLVYRRRQHVIDLFAWPGDSQFGSGPTEGSRSGYNFLRWRRDGMVFWATSDLNAQELADFVRLWQAN